MVRMNTVAQYKANEEPYTNRSVRQKVSFIMKYNTQIKIFINASIWSCR